MFISGGVTNRYGLFSDTFEIEWTFQNPGSSLIVIRAIALRRWGDVGFLVETREEPRRDYVHIIRPWESALLNFVLPFSAFPSRVNSRVLSKQLEPGNKTRMDIRLEYTTGPTGDVEKSVIRRFEIIGTIKAADGYLAPMRAIPSTPLRLHP
jgi:hypothetical protein